MRVSPAHLVSVFAAVALFLGVAAAPASAIPAFSRIYNTPCSTCHSTAPHLNDTGRAFQANFFRFTSDDGKGGGGPPRKRGLIALPVTAIATADTVRNTSLHTTSNFRFEMLQLFASDNFVLDRMRNGGYFVYGTAAVREGKAGDLGDAWAAVPVAGKRGQLAITAGQFTPMMYQYDPVNSLTVSLPVGLSQGADGVAFTGPVPGVRLDFFDHRGQGTQDGNYLAVGLPLGGHWTLNDESRVYQARGIFVHGFRRQGKGSLGAFGYANGGRHQIGILGTFEALPNLEFLAAAATAHDVIGDLRFTNRGYSLEADWSVLPNVALTGRLDSTTGLQKDTYPVAAVTYFPFSPSVLRLSVETVQQKGNKQVALAAYLLF